MQTMTRLVVCPSPRLVNAWVMPERCKEELVVSITEVMLSSQLWVEEIATR